MTIRVGVVTPTLNAARYLDSCLASIWNHVPDGIELDHLVVDGGSGDETLAIVGKYPSRVLKSADDGGMYDAVNRGMAAVKGDIVAYVNSDDELTELTLRVVAQTFQAGSDTTWMCGGVDLIDASGNMVASRKLAPVTQRALVALEYSPIPSLSVWCRRAFQDRVGRFDTSLRLASDYDWYIRALGVSTPVFYPDALGRFRLHTANLSSNAGGMASEIARIVARYPSPDWRARYEAARHRVHNNAINPRWFLAKKRAGLVKRLPAALVGDRSVEWWW